MKKTTIKIATGFALATLISSTSIVYASGDHNHSDGMQMSSMPGDMKSKMSKMKADMTAIQNENDPKKRKAMMKAHMQDMKSMMGMMKDKRANMQGKMDKMKQLEARVAMMEAMMEQVMDTHITSLDPNDPVYKLD